MLLQAALEFPLERQFLLLTALFCGLEKQTQTPVQRAGRAAYQVLAGSLSQLG